VTGNLTLSSPVPSGESQAYIIQTDPFFTQMRAWGDTIWNLWTHNMNLEGAVPFLMAEADIETSPTGDLFGMKFYDSDQDGVHDPEEDGLPDWEIHLFGNGLDLSVLTDGAGHYSFENIPYGTYTLSEVIPSNWYQTYPESGTWLVTLEAGNDLISDLDFGNAPAYNIFLPVVLNVFPQ
jgi:hypothetical protein